MGEAGNIAVRILTTITLTGLLLSAGLALNWAEIAHSLRRNRLVWMLPVNFILVPVLALGLAGLFQISQPIAVGMLLLGAAPFAPVVPTFTRLAKADLALASALTGLCPFLSAFLTPLICGFGLKQLAENSSMNFQPLTIFLVLFMTITLPLTVGVTVRHFLPTVGSRLLKPIQVFSEAAGAISLVLVSVLEFKTITSIGLKPLLAMALLSELSFIAGYASSGPSPASRFVVGLGTSNRNIALAVLVALQSFAGTPVMAAVVANGLLMIMLGCLHVVLWRRMTQKQNRA